MARPAAPGGVHGGVEILVHIAAPSRAADDARYRQLAQAYLAFQPGSRTNIADGRGLDAGDESSSAAEHPQQQRGSDSAGQAPEPSGGASPPSFIPESQELSFNGAVDNHGSFRTRDAGTAEIVPGPSAASPPKSWHSPPSHISDSYPLPDTRLVSSSRAAALEKCFLPFAPSGDVPSPPSQRQTGSAARGGPAGDVQVPSSIPVPDSQERPDNRTVAAVTPAEIVPVTPMLPGPAPQRKRKAFEAYDQTVIERTRPASSDATHVSDSFPHRAGSAPPASKRPGPSPQPLVRSTSDAGPAARARHKTARAPVPELETVAEAPRSSHPAADHALEVRAPSPPPGIAALSPADLVSAKLTQLTRDLPSRFHPRRARPTRPLERGYWLADCAGWPAPARADAWRFLAEYVRGGLAGWGVWCARADAPHAWIRVYCWGHVVEHAYLLLYLASGRRLKATGARWYDGDGEVVLEVMPREKQGREADGKGEGEAGGEADAEADG